MILRGPQRPLILIMYILKDIVNITSTKLPSEKCQNYISTENMLPNKGGITQTAHVPQTGTVSIYQKGDTLISNIRPYFKKIWHATTEGTASNDILIFHPTEKVNDLYLYYLLSDDRFFAYVMTGAKGTKMPRGDKAQILQYPVFLPSLDEQKRIAGVLGAFDDKIELLQKQNTTLENMAKALFKSWFVDFDVVHAKQQGQPKAAVMQQYHLTEELYNLFPSSFEPSALGPIPTGWQVKELGDFFPVKTGKKDANVASKKGKYPFFSCAQTILYTNEYSFDNTALLLAGNGDFNLKWYRGKFEAYQRTYVLIPFNSDDFPFLYYSMQFFLDKITLGSRGSVIKFITKGMIEKYQIVIPSKEIWSFISNLFGLWLQKIEVNNKQIQTLTEMRDALLPRLISGKIRV